MVCKCGWSAFKKQNKEAVGAISHPKAGGNFPFHPCLRVGDLCTDTHGDAELGDAPQLRREGEEAGVIAAVFKELKGSGSTCGSLLTSAYGHFMTH